MRWRCSAMNAAVAAKVLLRSRCQSLHDAGRPVRQPGAEPRKRGQRQPADDRSAGRTGGNSRGSLPHLCAAVGVHSSRASRRACAKRRPPSTAPNATGNAVGSVARVASRRAGASPSRCFAITPAGGRTPLTLPGGAAMDEDGFALRPQGGPDVVTSCRRLRRLSSRSSRRKGPTRALPAPRPRTPRAK